jgi:hypothetical protein
LQLGKLEKKFNILLLLVGLVHGHLKELPSFRPQDDLLG